MSPFPSDEAGAGPGHLNLDCVDGMDRWAPLSPEPATGSSPVQPRLAQIDGAAPGGLLTALPVQHRVAEELLDLAGDRPVADLVWAQDAADWIEEELGEHAAMLGPERLRISKGTVVSVLACEARHVVQEDFRWSAAMAKGTIVHRAIALAAGGSAALPGDLAWSALDQATSECGRELRDWLGDLTDDQRLSIVGEAIAGIAGFVEAFPLLEASWRPIAEWPVAATIAAGKVRVSGRVDISLGAPRPGPRGIERRRLLLEVKTGPPRPEHRADHLLYALLETLRSRIAPWRAATFYTTDSTWVVDDINEELLGIAAARLVEATKRLIELHSGRPPAHRPGWRCEFCPIERTCPVRLHRESLEGENHA